MRLLNAAAAALLASCFSAVTAAPSPNFEISKTSVNIDKHREKLDNGEIIVRVQRTDDLFSDPSANAEAKLLLEKNTHIALRIQLDTQSGKVNVNDHSLDVTGHEGATLSGIKVETIKLPAEHNAPVVDADQMLELVNQMSLGIAKVEIRLESEQVSPTIGMATFNEGEELPSIEASSVRRVGLFLRITEIEGKLLSHTTSIYTPYLQLVVVSSGNNVNKISTLAIDGKAPIEDAIRMPNAVEFGKLPENSKPIHAHGFPHRHHERPAGLFGWLARMFGLRGKPEEHGRHGFGHGKPRGGCNKMRKQKEKQEKAENAKTGRLATHRPLLENPFSDMVDDDEGYESSSGGVDVNSVEDRNRAIAHSGVGLGFGAGAPIGAHRRPHHHQHHDGPFSHRRHGRCGAFFRHFGQGFLHGLSLVGGLFLHPISLAVAAGLLAGGLVCRLLRKKREGDVVLGEEGEKEASVDDKEKEALLYEVVVEDEEELPVYEAQA